MKKVTRFIYIISAWFIWFGLLFTTAGCITTTKSRVEGFINFRQSFVGKNITDLEKNLPDRLLIGTKSLLSGNLEREYFHHWLSKYEYESGAKKRIYQCHFFYEYEPQTGLIKKFRIEEKSKDACQASGV